MNATPEKFDLVKGMHTLKNLYEYSEDSINIDEYTGRSFEEFWDLLPHKIEFFDYEQDLLDVFTTTKKIWIKKSTGLGITEFIIRWIAWRCLSSNVMRDKQVDTNVVMITGPRIDLAITVMNRLKALLPDVPKGKETVCVLNGNRIEAFPSHHLASARGLNPQIVFLDEADFFPPGQQQEARMVSERYIAKTDPHILMVSTPNLPGGLYDTMEAEGRHGLSRLFQSRIFLVILLIMTVVSFMRLISEVTRRAKINTEIDRLKTEILSLENEREALSSLIHYLNTDAYIEEQARKKLNLSKPGESVVIINDQGARQLVADRSLTRQHTVSLWWRYFFDSDK